MATKYLNDIFRNYFRTIAFCHSPDIETALEKAGTSVFIDVFAHLPALNSWVLCWSTTGPNTLNRVFISDSHADFAAASSVKEPKVVHISLQDRTTKEATQTDVTPLYQSGGMDTMAYRPLWSQKDGIFGMIRIVGRSTDISAAGHPKGGICSPVDPPEALTLPDSDLLPHVLGRWAGSIYGLRETTKPLTVLLKAFASFFPTSHSMYWKRDFDTDEILFHFSPTPHTDRLLRGLRAPIHTHDYMFAIVAERGASEIVDDFPEDLMTDLRINASKWKPTEHFNHLCLTLQADRVSYIGIPLKVDDSVVGVISVVTPRGSSGFPEAARFARSALSEMGRTMDKSAVSRASRIIRQFTSEKAADGKNKSDLIPLGRELVSKLVAEIIPFGAVSVGAIEARLGAEGADISGLPVKVATLIQKSLASLVISEKISFFVVEPEPNCHAHHGVLVVPVPASIPFVLYVSGPLALLGGRSLRSALEQMQAVLLVSIAASERTSGLAWDLSNWREHIALWSQIHDIKNETAAFGTPLTDLINVAQHGTHEDLVEEVFLFKERFNRTIKDFETKCDNTLKGAGFRKRETASIYDAIRKSWGALARSHRELAQRCSARYIGDRSISAVTYAAELELVLRNLLTNTLKHFERQSKFGIITFAVKKIDTDKEIIISIKDNIEEAGALRKVNSILDDSDSKATLRRLIKPIVERQLQGRIWAEPNPETDSVIMLVGIPQKALAH